jgi:hypothetical protein
MIISIIISIIFIILICKYYKIKEDLTIIYNIEQPSPTYLQGWVDENNKPYNPRWMFLKNYFYPV